MKKLLFLIACAYGMSVHAMNIHRKKIIDYPPSTIDCSPSTIEEVPAAVYDEVEAAIINPFDKLPQINPNLMYLGQHVTRIKQAFDKIEAVIQDPSVFATQGAKEEASPLCAIVRRTTAYDYVSSCKDSEHKLERRLPEIATGDDGQKLSEIQKCIEHLTSDDRSSLFNIIDGIITREFNEHRRRTMIDEIFAELNKYQNQDVIPESRYEGAHLKKANALAKLQRLLDLSSISPKDHSNKIINHKYY